MSVIIVNLPKELLFMWRNTKMSQKKYGVGNFIGDFIITMIFLALVLILIIPLSIYSLSGG